MPTEHLGHIHHSGKSLCHTPVFIRIIALLRWAVERLAVQAPFWLGLVKSVCRAPIGSGIVRAGA